VKRRREFNVSDVSVCMQVLVKPNRRSLSAKHLNGDLQISVRVRLSNFKLVIFLEISFHPVVNSREEGSGNEVVCDMIMWRMFTRFEKSCAFLIS